MRRIAAVACVAALAASIAGPALHAEQHAREAAADARPARAPASGRPIVRVTHHVSDELDGGGFHRDPDGTWHRHAGAPHHHHDGDRPGHHGDDAPEHLAFAIAAPSPTILPPPFVVERAIDPIAPRATIACARAIDTHRSRGPPARA